MIYGKTQYFHPNLEYALGLAGENIIGGPATAVEKQTKNFVIVIPGKENKGALAKRIKHKLKGGDLDEIITFLPAGGAEIRKL